MAIFALSLTHETEKNGTIRDKAPKKMPLRHQNVKWYYYCIAIILVTVVAFAKEKSISEFVSKDGMSSLKLKQCPEFCDARSKQLKSHHGGDRLDPHFMLLNLEKEREKVHNKLREDYGEQAFTSMWVNAETKKVIGDRVCVSPNPESNLSYRKFRRKLLMKLLKVQISILDEQQDLNGCDCTQTDAVHARRLQSSIKLPRVPPFYEHFVWSTGGHSAAAGHGNFFNESYTAFMERGVKDLFRSVGIEFVGRNYAMGGMDSAPQLALCNEAVYGADADVISWDFGMTDGGATWKTNFYASRAGVHSNRPVHVSISVAGRHLRDRISALKLAEDAGVPTLYLSPDVESQVERGIPDSFGMPEEELQKLGPYARYLKCKDALEKGDMCGTMKFSNEVCPDRSFKTSWHPGWKAHAMTGTMLALFLTETMLDAVKLLVESGEEPRKLLAKLTDEEDNEYDEFLNSTVPDKTEDLISADLVAAGLKSQSLFRNKAICRTSLLPAQTRYLGLFSDEGKKEDKMGYVQGVDVIKAIAGILSPSSSHNLTLVYDAKFRQKCPVDLNIDYKDCFYATQNYGWASLIFPANSEVEAYTPVGFKPVGLVVICFVKCDWGKCPVGEVSVETFNVDWKMELSGEPVTELTRIDECFLLKTKKGYYHTPNMDAQYKLRVSIDKVDSVPLRYIRITSLIVV